MILGGIWHGAGVFFLLWGIYHGMLLTFYRIIPINTYLKKYLGKVGKWLAITIMFVSTVYGWILFFSKTNAQFHKLSGGFFKVLFHPLSLSRDFTVLFYTLLVFILPLIITDSIGYKRNRQFVELYPALTMRYKIPLYISMLYLLIYFSGTAHYAFIYFQF